jgi:hypothetical protein
MSAPYRGRLYGCDAKLRSAFAAPARLAATAMAAPSGGQPPAPLARSRRRAGVTRIGRRTRAHRARDSRAPSRSAVKRSSKHARMALRSSCSASGTAATAPSMSSTINPVSPSSTISGTEPRPKPPARSRRKAEEDLIRECCCRTHPSRNPPNEPRTGADMEPLLILVRHPAKTGSRAIVKFYKILQDLNQNISVISQRVKIRMAIDMIISSDVYLSRYSESTEILPKYIRVIILISLAVCGWGVIALPILVMLDYAPSMVDLFAR